MSNAEEAFAWYRKIFGTGIIIFKDAATASHCLQVAFQQSLLPVQDDTQNSNSKTIKSPTIFGHIAKTCYQGFMYFSKKVVVCIDQ